MIYLADTETTDIANCDVIELSYIPLIDSAEYHRKELTWRATSLMFENEAFSKRYKPNKLINANATKVHGLTLKHLKDCHSCDEIKLPEGICHLVGHNINFDWRALGKPDVKLICTMQIAKKIWPEFKEQGGYGLQNLIKLLYPDTAKYMLTFQYHSSLTDIKLTYLLLIKILQKLAKIENLNELVKFTTQGKR